jgi:diadenosine tetraphosphatase ApaH/serine/threonine PP2A family protein phosphatase
MFFDSVPRKHLDFLTSLTLYHQTADVVCVHGGVLDDRPLHLQDPQTLIWGPDGFPDGYHGQEAVVYGHRDNSVPDEKGWPRPCLKANRTFGIDTISHGFLTAMSFPDLQVIQSGSQGWE